MKRPRFASLPATWLAMMLVLCGGGIPAAEDTLATARRLRLTGRYVEAAEIYARLADKEPVAAALGLARCRRAMGKLDEAAETLRQAAKTHQAAAVLPAELARLAFERGDHDAAQRHVENAMKRDANQLLARWVGAELHRTAGRLDEADAACQWFVDFYNETDQFSDPESLRWIGLAATQWARWHRNSRQFHFLVGTLYPDATGLDGDFWQSHYESGLLFSEKYNQADAAAALAAALAINPNAAEVHVARAALALQTYDLDGAAASIQQARQVNPRLLSARWVEADLLMANFQVGKAVKVLEEARPLNPVSEETLGRLAAACGAVDGLKDDPAGSRMGRIIDKATRRNARAGRFFAVLAESLDRLRKFPAAARYYDEAVRRMPQLMGVRGKLGLMYMRLGEEAKAEKLLEASFQIDPFNVRVKNMLAVLEVLRDYEVRETEHFVIKYDKARDELLVQYVAEYLEQHVYPQIVATLGFAPPEKSLLEIFSRARNTAGHGWFSARMVGLPYVGTVGACAGKMVAITSPSEMKERRKFNWARVLRHEFVHVVNLQQTSFNIPHWFTEALAVQNEGYPRPPGWNEVLARRVQAGTTFNLDTLNLGFIRPASSDDWTLAYCQAELYAEYMVSAYGEDGPAKMLAAYADNLNTRDAIERCFGLGQEAFDRGYAKYVGGIVDGLPGGDTSAPMSFVQLQKAVQADPQSADLAAQLAYAFLLRKGNADARRHALAALAVDARHQLAGYVMARLYLSIGDVRRALMLLEACLDEESPQERALTLLAALKFKVGDYDEAERLYMLGARREPQREKWTKALARVYLKSQNHAKLTETLARLAALDSDNLPVRTKLAQLALAAKNYRAAADWANQALHIDVMDADTHAVLAQSLAALDQHTRASREYEVAVDLHPRQLPWRLALAEQLVKANQPEKARAVLERLLGVDPDYLGAKTLRESLKP